jgi:hypothetical protein
MTRIRSTFAPEERTYLGSVATSQREEILALYASSPQLRATPAEVWGLLGKRGLLTSIRRAITELTQEGYLEKDEHNRKPGEYGISNATWGLKRKELDLFGAVG